MGASLASMIASSLQRTVQHDRPLSANVAAADDREPDDDTECRALRAAFLQRSTAIALRETREMATTYDAIIIGTGQAGPHPRPPVRDLGAAGGDRRTQAVRRHLRQHRLHSDQDDGRQRLRRAPGAPRGGLRRHDRRRRQRRHGAREGAEGRRFRAVADGRRERRCARSNAAPSTRATRGSSRRARSASARSDSRPSGSSSTSAAAPSCRRCPESTRCRSSPTAR